MLHIDLFIDFITSSAFLMAVTGKRKLTRHSSVQKAAFSKWQLMSHDLCATRKIIANWQQKVTMLLDQFAVHWKQIMTINVYDIEFIVTGSSQQKLQCYSVNKSSEWKNRGWQSYPGSCSTSSQILIFFSQSISLSLPLIVAFTISVPSSPLGLLTVDHI